MALIHGSLKRALLKYPNMDLSNIRLIGWGAGQFFQDHYPYIKEHLKLEYTVYPRQENHGKTIHGLEVKPIEAIQAAKCFKSGLYFVFSVFCVEGRLALKFVDAK